MPGILLFAMTDIPHRKIQLRRDLRQRRNNLSTSTQHAAAQALINAIVELPNWPTAQRIALYLPADGEIDTGPLETLARSQRKQIFLPVIADDNCLSFASWNVDASLVPTRYDIPEPPTGAKRCPVSDLDIVFLPVVGWDRRGGRLGMGGGFYDRTLANITGPLLVGLAHAGQQVENLSQDSWDIALDYIATDAGLFCKEAV
jgi:5-formyltetrahydrofolate cyclo-ligase